MAKKQDDQAELVRALRDVTIHTLRGRLWADEIPKLVNKKSARFLLGLLDDPDRKLRIGAIRALGVIRAKSAIKRLIPIQDEADPEARVEAINALALIGHPQAKGRLLELLDDPDANVRWMAVKTLQAVGDASDVERLFELIHDPDANVRFVAVFALKAVGDAPVVEKLIHDPDAGVRRALANALGDAGDASVVERLLELIHDPDAGVRLALARALRQLGGIVAVEGLISLLGDTDKGVASSACSALGELGNTRAVEPLIAILNSDPDATRRANAIQALARISDRRAIQACLDVLNDPESGLRDGLLYAAGWSRKLRGRIPIDTLSSLLRTHADKDIRRGAIRILGHKKAPAAADALTEALADQDIMVRLEAALELSQSGDARAIQPLVALFEDADNEMYFELCKLLDRLVSPDKLNAPRRTIIQALERIDTAESLAAASMLGHKKASAAVDALLRMLADRDIRVRVEAALALGQYGDARAIQPLVALFEDADNEVYREIHRWVGGSFVPDKLKLPRMEIVRALEQIGTVESLAAAKELRARLKSEI